MSQATTWGVPQASPASPTEYAQRDQASLDALMTLHRGNARPPYLTSGLWIDDSAGAAAWVLKFWDGSQDISILVINTTANIFVPVGYALNNLTATTAPTVNDDSGDGYAAGSIWVNTVTKAVAVLKDATLGAAVWEEITNRLPKTGGTLTGDLIVPSLNGGQLAGFRNRLLNGGFEIMQRAITQLDVSNTGQGYLFDAWAGVANNGGGVMRFTQTSGPDGFAHALSLLVQTADASIGAGEYYLVQQSVEGFDVADLRWGTAFAKSVTLSFYAASTVLGTYSLYLRNSDSSRTYIATFVVGAASTWTRYTVTIPGDTGGTWLADAGKGLDIGFVIGGGSSLHGAAGAWGNNGFKTAASVNLISTAGANLVIAGVQLETGVQATPFEWRGFHQELSMCQRRYEKTFDYAQLPGIANNGAIYVRPATVSVYFDCRFKVRKRTAPTVVPYSPTTGATGMARDASTNADAAVTGTAIGEHGCLIYTDTGVAGRAYTLHYTASADF